jgi:maleate isomerase
MQKTARKPMPMRDNWERLEPRYGEEIGYRASIGLLALSTDRAGAFDTEEFLRAKGVAMFSTRIPMAPVATPETLAAMAAHLLDATRLLVPGSRLDVIGFSCTSGTVAIGVDKVHEAIRAARPEVQVTTPIEAGYEALRQLGAKRITLVVPYLVKTAELVSGYFEQKGIEILRRATFALDGDPDMNRLSPEALVEATVATDSPDSQGVFISCTGLRTAPVISALEQRLRKPVVTSNQALAWHALRLAGITDRLEGRGLLFAMQQAFGSARR